jgi:hypothetical protein
MVRTIRTEANMAVTADKPTPYAPPSAILELIERHRNRGLPPVINGEVLGRAGISESLIPRTMQALVTLDLIDEMGKPTATFEGIRLAPEVEYKKRLEDWLKGTYADVFSFVDPTQDDETKIRDAFRTYQPVGQQTRMVTLFQGLCAAAGIAPVKPAKPKPQASAPRNFAPLTQKRLAQASVKNTAAKQVVTNNGIPAPLAGLLASLPPEGGDWTQTQRDKFVNTFSAVLDFCFQIVEPGSPEAQEQSHE